MRAWGAIAPLAIVLALLAGCSASAPTICNPLAPAGGSEPERWTFACGPYQEGLEWGRFEVGPCDQPGRVLAKADVAVGSITVVLERDGGVVWSKSLTSAPSSYTVSRDIAAGVRYTLAPQGTVTFDGLATIEVRCDGEARPTVTEDRSAGPADQVYG